MKRDDTVYLQHILDAINRTQEYLQDIDEKTFHQQYLIQDGIIRQLEIIGEAVKHLSSELRDNHPLIPWQDIAGMRDRLIHHYMGVDMNEVWLAATEDVPILKGQVAYILDDLDRESKTDGDAA